tara:strand:- start:276 stop:437 length:162 start_codon:yes stop_codon:yes gene_type:complete
MKVFWIFIQIIVWTIAVSSVISVISPFTKTLKDNAFAAKVQKFIDLLALNFKK